MKIGENIRALRQRKGLTQEQVAQQLGVSYQAVSKWENEANTPDIGLLPGIAALFGVSIDALFADEAADLAAGIPFVKDDDVIRIVQMRGRQVIEVTPRISADDPPIEIAFPRNCNDRTQYFKVEVYGHVMADGSINGDVVCHQSIECAQINGDVRAQGNVTAGNINACGNIVCSGIYDCYNLQANRIECSGSVSAINLTCGE
ncbi:MAG: helix-turn-helix transcriptional regulator [Clostridiales bacterium]|nr:helix-turn-helix transcriptional regulator [Clostridiales bacterium]